jgi:hypothetical protein
VFLAVVLATLLVAAPASAEPANNPWTVVYSAEFLSCSDGQLSGYILEPRTPGMPFVNFGTAGSNFDVMKVFTVDQHIAIYDVGSGALLDEFSFAIDKPGRVPPPAETCVIDGEEVVSTPGGDLRIVSTGMATVLMVGSG